MALRDEIELHLDPLSDFNPVNYASDGGGGLPDTRINNDPPAGVPDTKDTSSFPITPFKPSDIETKDNDEEPTDIERLIDVMGNLFGQGVSTPAGGGEPVVIPTTQSSNSILPFVVIVTGVGIVGYYLYKRQKES